MKPQLVFASLAVMAMTLAPIQSEARGRQHPAHHAGAASQTANASFKAAADRFIASLVRLSPVEGTALGDHRHDGELPDMTTAGRAARAAEWRSLLTALSGIDRARLTRDNQVDYALLANELRYRLWADEREQGWAWNPQVYNDLAAGSLYGLAARDFAPWPDRLRSATARMEQLPALLAESRRQLDPARVPPVHAQTVARQNGGILEIVEGMLLPHADTLAAPDRARFDAAHAGLKAAVAQHQQWLDTVLVPGARGEFRLGAELYDEKMRFALVSDITRPRLLARALASKAQIREEMYALSRRVLAGRPGAPATPEAPSAEQQQAAIEAALALSYAVRPTRDRLEQRARETLEQATAFVRERGFIRMPDGPVRVITMPKFQQGNAVAYDDPPGPLERHLPNFYAVSPIPDDWSDEQATSFLSEYNDYMIHELSIHEGVPGHYHQLDHASRDPSVLRAVLWSSPFAEGWAVYAEQVMMDEGYLDRDPLYQLTVLKMRLRSVTNTIIDIGIHTGGMTREEAMDLMMKGAFQQEREAAGKWVRANLSSVQLLSYFTGYEEHRALRAEAERRWGRAFTLRRYHDDVLSHGTPPVKYARALMFGLPVE